MKLCLHPSAKTVLILVFAVLCICPTIRAEVRGTLTTADRKEIDAIVRKALDTTGVFRNCKSPSELKARIERIYVGDLADEIYERSLGMLSKSTDWPTNELKKIDLERDGKNGSQPLDTLSMECKGSNHGNGAPH